MQGRNTSQAPGLLGEYSSAKLQGGFNNHMQSNFSTGHFGQNGQGSYSGPTSAAGMMNPQQGLLNQQQGMFGQMNSFNQNPMSQQSILGQPGMMNQDMMSQGMMNPGMNQGMRNQGQINQGMMNQQQMLNQQQMMNQQQIMNQQQMMNQRMMNQRMMNQQGMPGMMGSPGHHSGANFARDFQNMSGMGDIGNVSMSFHNESNMRFDRDRISEQQQILSQHDQDEESFHKEHTGIASDSGRLLHDDVGLTQSQSLSPSWNGRDDGNNDFRVDKNDYDPLVPTDEPLDTDRGSGGGVGGDSGETFTCKLCGLEYSNIDAFDVHMQGLEHQNRQQNLSSLCQMQTQQQMQRVMVQEALRRIEKEDLRTCRICSKDFVGHYDEHRKSDMHRRKERMTKRGCQLCKTGSFNNYNEYVEHIDSESHKEAKAQLNKTLGQEDFDDKKPKHQKSSHTSLPGGHRDNQRNSKRSHGPDQKMVKKTKYREETEKSCEKSSFGMPVTKDEHVAEYADEEMETESQAWQNYIVPVEGWMCKICNEFFLDERTAKNRHCAASHHLDMAEESKKSASNNRDVNQGNQEGKMVESESYQSISVKFDNITSSDVAFDDEDSNDLNTLTVSEASDSCPKLQWRMPEDK